MIHHNRCDNSRREDRATVWCPEEAAAKFTARGHFFSFLYIEEESEIADYCQRFADRLASGVKLRRGCNTFLVQFSTLTHLFVGNDQLSAAEWCGIQSAAFVSFVLDSIVA